MTTESRQSHWGKPEDPPSSDRRPRILLIEDDGQMREMLAEALRQEGYDVTECTNGIPWLLFCVHNSGRDAQDCPGGYDVVVSDIRMPRMTALDVMRIIRDIHCDEACPPTILITAFGDDETRQTAQALGAAAVLDKPFQIKDLVHRIHELTSP